MVYKKAVFVGVIGVVSIIASMAILVPTYKRYKMDQFDKEMKYFFDKRDHKTPDDTHMR